MSGDGPLRLCVLGDLDSIHTRRWMQPFVSQGHEVHAVSYYHPAAAPEGVRVHVLDDRPRKSEATGDRSPRAGRMPPNLLRIANAIRYRRRGLARVIRDIQPDVLHAHYVVEYGFFAATVGFRPLVVTAWGSDVLVAARSSVLARMITGYTLRRADLVTSNNEYMTTVLRDMGVDNAKLATIVFGTDASFLEGRSDRANSRATDTRPLTIISTRSLDSPLYNVDEVLRAFAPVRSRLSEAQLLVAGTGRLRPHLEALAADLGISESVRFLGWLDDAALKHAFHDSHVYVSVPDSDATSVSTLSAMASGCFPVLSDVPTQREWVEDGVNGLLSPSHDVDGLAKRLIEALENSDLRRQAAGRNRDIVEARGIWQKNARVMEDWYHRLAARRKDAGDAPVLSG